MGHLIRSEEMALCQLFLHTECAYMCVSELGELGLVQFRDTVPDKNAFQRKFVNEVRRCEEMDRKLRYLQKEIKKDNIPLLDTEENPVAPAPREMVDLEATLEKLENELKEVNSNTEQLKRNFIELTELKHILNKMQGFFEETDMTETLISRDGMDNPLFAGSQLTASMEQHHVIPLESTRTEREQRIEFIAGVILREKLHLFERLLWRACRGNVFLKHAEIEEELEDPVSGAFQAKCVFAVFFQGDQLKNRVRKICEGFHASLYPCPDTAAERREMKLGVALRIEDLITVLNQTKDHRYRVLVAAAKNLKIWTVKVNKIKAIYHSLNLFNMDVTAKCMIGEAWCASSDIDQVRQSLQRGADRSNSNVAPILNRMYTKERPPTFHRTNKFTEGFQSIVDAYGVARYQEVNPMPFTVITFPFLFAVMFGDLGHGFLMFLFALWMVIYERSLSAKKSNNEIWNTFFGGRYIILLMGIFSVYTGLIYNDCFSKSFNIFGSSWYPNYTDSDIEHNKILQLDYTMFKSRGPYPYGVDPVWATSKNKISFSNSFKMKMSVILGVMQMLMGVFVSLMNNIHGRNVLNIVCETIPQVLFLTSIFGYLIVTIFYKWVTFSKRDAACAPSLLIMLINMFMFSAPPPGSKDKPCATWTFYSGQNVVQSILVVIAVICVPWMLLIKPFVLRSRHLSSQYLHTTLPEHDESDTDHPVNGDAQTHQDGHDDEPFNFGDTFVHQAIHTIEYCLGCISNTASYLRLWALSLAHGQLSEVLWSMVFSLGLRMHGYFGCVAIFALFAGWAIGTIVILLLMEGLSAFLHALRLHWVEFQNKFYAGDGYLFFPFSFQTFSQDTDSSDAS